MRDAKGILAVALCLGAIATGVTAEDVRLVPEESWSNVFADQQVRFHYAVASQKPFQGRLGWALSVSGRTLQRGETGVQAAAGRETTVEVTLRVPSVREEVALPALLEVQLFDLQGPAVARHERPVLIFSPNPFAGRTEWLEKRGLVLFDPIGQTEKCLKSAGVPFEHHKRLAGINELQEGILLVGEGISLAEHRGLAHVMIDAARRGVPVICLAPSDGPLPMPGADDEEALPREISFAHEEVFAKLDKRLDRGGWPPDGRIVASGLNVRAEKGQVVAAVEAGSVGWPWLEVRYPAPGGRLVVCGFGVVKHWEATPAARYLLAAIVEYVANDPKSNRKQPKE